MDAFERDDVTRGNDLAAALGRQQHEAAGVVDGLEPAGDLPGTGDRARRCRRRDAQRAGRRERAEDVVDVEAAPERRDQLDLAVGRPDGEARAVQPGVDVAGEALRAVAVAR